MDCRVTPGNDGRWKGEREGEGRLKIESTFRAPAPRTSRLNQNLSEG
jgi:hypothetical protein